MRCVVGKKYMAMLFLLGLLSFSVHTMTMENSGSATASVCQVVETANELRCVMEEVSQLSAKVVFEFQDLSLTLICDKSKDNVDALALALENMDTNYLETRGARLLHGAASAGNRNIADFLIDRGVSVDAIYKECRPLHQAIVKNQIACVELLLARKAQLQIEGECRGTTPLHIAASRGLTECVQKLLQYGAHVEPRNDVGATPFSEACHHNHPAIAYALGLEIYDHLFLTNIRFNCLYFSDEICAALEKAELVKNRLSRALSRMLLCPKTSPLLPFLRPKIIDLIDDYTAAKTVFEKKQERKLKLVIACFLDGDLLDTVDILLCRGIIDVNFDRGGNPLDLAAYRGNEKIVRRLLEYRADVTKRDVDGYTPFYHACTKNYPNIAALLRTHYSYDDDKIPWHTVSQEVKDAVEMVDAPRAQAISDVISHAAKSPLFHLPAELVDIIDDYQLSQTLFAKKEERKAALLNRYTIAEITENTNTVVATDDQEAGLNARQRVKHKKQCCEIM